MNAISKNSGISVSINSCSFYSRITSEVMAQNLQNNSSCIGVPINPTKAEPFQKSIYNKLTTRISPENENDEVIIK
jgi:hypothetical protein